MTLSAGAVVLSVSLKQAFMGDLAPWASRCLIASWIAFSVAVIAGVFLVWFKGQRYAGLGMSLFPDTKDRGEESRKRAKQRSAIGVWFMWLGFLGGIVLLLAAGIASSCHVATTQ